MASPSGTATRFAKRKNEGRFDTLGAKDALVKIKDMNCGLPDTMALVRGFLPNRAFK